MSFLRILLFTLISNYSLLHLEFCKAYQNCLVTINKITTVDSLLLEWYVLSIMCRFSNVPTTETVFPKVIFLKFPLLIYKLDCMIWSFLLVKRNFVESSRNRQRLKRPTPVFGSHCCKNSLRCPANFEIFSTSQIREQTLKKISIKTSNK